MNKSKHSYILLGLAILPINLLYTLSAFALSNMLPNKPGYEIKKKKPKSTTTQVQVVNPTTSTPANPGKNIVITNSWYTMQSGSTPWGYYHELIEKKDERYLYRYEMTKKENGMEYMEAVGGVAEEDLTPVAFNISKAGKGSTEINNGTFVKEGAYGHMIVDIQGAQKSRIKRSLSKGTILEIFFPIWLTKHMSEYKPGQKGSVKVFTEDFVNGGFTTKQVQFSAAEKDPSHGCMKFNIELDGMKSVWCMLESGGVEWMNINNNQIQVKHVASETQAKVFVDDSPKYDKSIPINQKNSEDKTEKKDGRKKSGN